MAGAPGPLQRERPTRGRPQQRAEHAGGVNGWGPWAAATRAPHSRPPPAAGRARRRVNGTRLPGPRNEASPAAGAPAAGRARWRVNGTRPPGTGNAAPREAPGWRRAGQLALAALWLLDAVLQYQTFMFSQGFPRMLAATAAGNPTGVAGPYRPAGAGSRRPLDAVMAGWA